MQIKVDENISLESLTQQYANEVFSVLDSYRDELREWLPFVDSTRSVQDSRDFITYSESAEKTFAILYQNSFTGLIGLKGIDPSNQRAEIGYWLSPAYQNKGITTKAGEALLDYGFNELNLNRIQVRVAVGNTKSIRVVEKLGFNFEGVERDGERLVDGFTDINVYSLLKRDKEQR